MKYIKRYNEDIDWKFDEEEFPLEDLKVGDKVLLNGDEYEKVESREVNARESKNYNLISTHAFQYRNEINIISDIRVRDDGETIIKLEGKWPWYTSRYWKKI